jgi:hypothetical protein
MKGIREYIRSLLGDNTTISFSDEVDDVLYESDEVWDSAMELIESLDIDVTADKDLRFFSTDYEGEVVGAAFSSVNEQTYRFVVVVDPDYEHLREDLIRDCLEDYDYCRLENDDLIVEVQDIETIGVLKESFGYTVASGSLLSG